jgi:hypothetical protein
MKVRDLNIPFVAYDTDEKRPVVDGNAHILDAIHRMANAPAGRIDVECEGKKIGTLTISTLMAALSDFISPSGEYSTIEIMCSARDYSSSSITRAVEDADADIIGLFVSNAEAGKTKITVRVNIENPEHVARSLQRYGYEVTAVYSSVTPDYDKLANHLYALQLYLHV